MPSFSIKLALPLKVIIIFSKHFTFLPNCFGFLYFSISQVSIVIVLRKSLKAFDSILELILEAPICEGPMMTHSLKVLRCL